MGCAYVDAELLARTGATMTDTTMSYTTMAGLGQRREFSRALGYVQPVPDLPFDPSSAGSSAGSAPAADDGAAGDIRPRIVIVGGGFAGFWAAAAARRVGGEHLDITLVSTGPVLQMRPRFYEANPAELGVDLQPLLEALEVTFVVDVAVGVDLEARSLRLQSQQPQRFDRLIVATGSVMARPPVAGAEEAFSIDTQHDAIVFDAHLAALADDSRPLCIVVVGAGFTGIELALELRDRVAAHLSTTSANLAEEMRIVLVDRAATLGVELGPNPQTAIATALADARVETRLGVSITELTDQSVTFADGSMLQCDAVVLATGLRAASFVDAIPGDRDTLGRLVVDRSLRAPRAPAVFVTGDAVAAATGDGHTTLQSCQHALQLGRFAGANAALDLLGQDTIEYEQLRYVTCLDLGRSGAVLTNGWDRDVVMIGDQAKAVKRRINTETIYPPAGATKEQLMELSNTPPQSFPR